MRALGLVAVVGASGNANDGWAGYNKGTENLSVLPSSLVGRFGMLLPATAHPASTERSTTCPSIPIPGPN
ncbi:hypothetical protein BN381_240013 [Candidatus Microthrix parvicella RN1]|uniref:Uncharacterized protein n=1 Tax=Candidatus Neomicrothrix parvicella RN1 TaxID=1229780 RepID=R4Z2I9_9ACTN|nr:hypothetical protein BN381_240013 [Candidatus Microthrix parvicella RN1]